MTPQGPFFYVRLCRSIGNQILIFCRPTQQNRSKRAIVGKCSKRRKKQTAMKQLVSLLGAHQVCAFTGIIGLPQFWLQARLAGANLLPSNHPELTTGIAGRILQEFELDAGKIRKFVTAQPAYLPFARRIKEEMGSPTRAQISAFNAGIIALEDPDENSALGAIRTFGLNNEKNQVGRSLIFTGMLRNWNEFHTSLIAGQIAVGVGGIPLLESSYACPFTGIKHLMRAYLKGVLAATGILNKDYPAQGPGFDAMLCKLLGITPQQFIALLVDVPPYSEFIARLQPRIIEISGRALAKFNWDIEAYQHDPGTARRILTNFGFEDNGSFSLAAADLNPLEDITAIHEQLVTLAGITARDAEVSKSGAKPAKPTGKTVVA